MAEWRRPITTLFVDRDGTINVERGYVHRAEEFHYLPRALEGLQLASSSGLTIFIVTNQAGIARGYYTEAQYLEFTENMVRRLALEGIRVAGVFHCPHHPDGTVERYRMVCDCRKPGTGMLRRALDQASLSAASAAMIGDKNSDVEAGRKMGMLTYLVETGYGKEESATTAADYVVPDLLAAVQHILMTRGPSDT